MHFIGRKIVPSLYRKFIDDLKITGNLSNKLYIPEFSVEDGIKEMVETIEEYNI
jgi:hypothetical protein